MRRRIFFLRQRTLFVRHAQTRQRARDDRVHVQLLAPVRALVHRARPAPEQTHGRAQTAFRRADAVSSQSGRSVCAVFSRLRRAIRRAQGRRQGKRLRVDGVKPGEHARAGAETDFAGDRAIHVQGGCLFIFFRVSFVLFFRGGRVALLLRDADGTPSHGVVRRAGRDVSSRQVERRARARVVWILLLPEQTAPHGRVGRRRRRLGVVRAVQHEKRRREVPFVLANRARVAEDVAPLFKVERVFFFFFLRTARRRFRSLRALRGGLDLALERFGFG